VIDGGGLDAGFGSNDRTDQFGVPIMVSMSAKSDFPEEYKREDVVFNRDGFERSDWKSRVQARVEAIVGYMGT
jgi:hypothetical protein